MYTQYRRGIIKSIHWQAYRTSVMRPAHRISQLWLIAAVEKKNANVCIDRRVSSGYREDVHYVHSLHVQKQQSIEHLTSFKILNTVNV